MGRHVVRIALEQGHTVVALARTPSDVEPARHRRLYKFTLDLSRGADHLSTLLLGCHIVISCLGNRRGEVRIMHLATEKLLPAMVSAGVPKLVMISCVGIGDSSKQLCGSFRFSPLCAHRHIVALSTALI